MKYFWGVFLIALFVSGFVGMYATSFVEGQNYTEVTGILSSDTTWTKSGSPYSLTGPVLVDYDVTLTIEAGVTVYLNEHYIQVEGTLSARGSSTDKIYFINGSEPTDGEMDENWAINFKGSSGWDEQTDSGCIIENAVLDSAGIVIIGYPPKICNNLINASAAVDIFCSNFVLSDNIIYGSISLHESASKINITNNVITNGRIQASQHDGSIVISNNTIQNGDDSGYGITCSSVNISDNIISDCKIGISAGRQALIENNLIINNEIGIRVSATLTEPMIRNNTIADNSVGIEIAGPYSPSPTIIYNNIQNNTKNVYLSDTSKDYNLTYNWWGTTDTSAINETIFDFKYDFNLGKVTFVPFLTEQNSEAPEIPEFPSWIILPLLLSLTLVVVFFGKNLAKRIGK